MDTQKYKERLETEKTKLTEELQGIGRQINADGDWMATSSQDEDGFRADKNENADNVEEFQENVAVLSTLEQQYEAVSKALDRIGDGSYGKCSNCGDEIKSARLDANPAADTCEGCMGK
jgi:RNA polymerase-binding transcription factor DksA